MPVGIQFASIPTGPRIADGLYDLGSAVDAGTVPTVDPAATASNRSGGMSIGLLPILDGGYGPDSRFSVIDVPVRPDGGKYPQGTIGIVIPGTKETAQENLFFPVLSAASLVAVNHAGDPSMASTVADLLADGSVDPTRLARLQSAWWVIKGSEGEPNSLAWQLGKSGRGDVYGGMIIDSPWGTAPQGAKIIGLVSVNQGGFVDVGGTNDRHQLHADADGHPINPAHIFTGGLFRMNRDFDGPLAFEARTAPQVVCGPQNIPVHLGWDETLLAWRWWAESAWSIITPPPDTPWEPPWIETPTPEKPPTTEEPPPTTATIDPHPEPAPLPPGHPPLFPDVPGGMIGGGFGDVGVMSSGGGSPHQGAVGFQGIMDMMGQGHPSHPITPAHQLTDPPTPIASSSLEISAPSAVFRPTLPTDPDIRRNPTPDYGELDKYNAESPVTIHIEPFGTRTRSGLEWIYTEKPGESRWTSGTASGGVAFLAPEADVITQNPSSLNRVRSTTLVVAGPGVSWASGEVDTISGTLSLGQRWTHDGTGLAFTRSTGTNRFRVNDAGTLDFAGTTTGLTNFGRFTHSNTAPRTYTFPDKSDTVAMLSDVVAPGAHNILSVTHSDTTATAVVQGDIIMGTGVGPTTWQRLARGTATGQFLRTVTTELGWSTLTLPNSVTQYAFLYGATTNNVGELATNPSAILVTNAGAPALPSFGYDIPAGITIGGASIVTASGTNTFTNTNTFNKGTIPDTAIELNIDAIGVAGTRDSHALVSTGRSNNGVDHSIQWKTFVDVTSNAGASNYVWQKQIDGGGYANQMSIVDAAGLILYNNSAKEAYLDVTGLTANRNFVFPDAGGTVALTSDLFGGTTLTDDAPVTLTTTARPQQNYTLTAAADRTINASGTGSNGQIIIVQIKSSAAIARTITFGTNFKSTGVLLTPVSATLFVTAIFHSDGANWIEDARQSTGV